MKAVMLALAALACCAPGAQAQTGCGGLLEPACPEPTVSPAPTTTPSPSATPTPTSTPAPKPKPKATRLTRARFRAIERVLRAAVANGKPRPTPRAAALYSRRCASLDRRDAVLGPYRRLCRPLARAYVYVNRGCYSARSCRRQFAFEARVSGAIVRAAPRANAGFGRALAPGACRRELALSAAEIRAQRVLMRVLRRAARLYGRVSQRRFERLFERKAAQLRPLRTPGQELRGLRRNC